jgi:hypothetical protein
MTRSILAMIAVFSATAAHANWYSGDPYTANTAWPQYTDNLSDANQIRAMTFDNFTWTPTFSNVVDSVGGHFHAFGDFNGTFHDTAYWEIRTGMSNNVAGTLVTSGSGTVVWVPTSFTQGGFPVWRTHVDVLDFPLPAGNYWFGLAIGSSTRPAGAYVASTTGASGIGGPLNDSLSIYYQIFGATVTWDYVESAIINPPNVSGFDPSYYIRVVPEPHALMILGMGLATLLGARPKRSLRREVFA